MSNGYNINRNTGSRYNNLGNYGTQNGYGYRNGQGNDLLGRIQTAWNDLTNGSGYGGYDGYTGKSGSRRKYSGAKSPRGSRRNYAGSSGSFGGYDGYSGSRYQGDAFGGEPLDIQDCPADRPVYRSGTGPFTRETFLGTQQVSGRRATCAKRPAYNPWWDDVASVAGGNVTATDAAQLLSQAGYRQNPQQALQTVRQQVGGSRSGSRAASPRRLGGY